jgi:hypothetical protein
MIEVLAVAAVLPGAIAEAMARGSDLAPGQTGALPVFATSPIEEQHAS